MALLNEKIVAADMLHVSFENMMLPLWIVVYGLGLIGGALAIAMCAVPRWQHRLVWRFVRACALANVILLTANALDQLQLAEQFNARSNVGVALLGTCAGAAIVLVYFQFRKLARTLPRRWRTAGRRFAYPGVFVLAVAGMSAQFYQVAFDPFQPADYPLLAPLLERVPASSYAVTDSGRHIPLYHYSGQHEELVTRQVLDSVQGRVILHDDQEQQASNCHGWVFTGGKFLVSGAYVDEILQDHDYKRIDSPEPNDLVVYRNVVGTPIHTGIVKAVGPDGFVLIESKWGPLNTYLHPPEVQVYSPNYAYYRSTRYHHRLHIIHESADPGVPPAPSELARAAIARQIFAQTGVSATLLP